MTRTSKVVGVAVAAALIAVGSGAFAPRLHRAEAAMSVVTLTSTLEVNSYDTLRETRYIWNGPSTAPVIRLTGTQFAKLEHLRIEVPSGFRAKAAIEFAPGTTSVVSTTTTAPTTTSTTAGTLGRRADDGRGKGRPSSTSSSSTSSTSTTSTTTSSSSTVTVAPYGNHVTDVKVGIWGVDGNFDYGILWSAGTNNTVTNVTVHGATLASMVLESGATQNAFRGFYSFFTPIGIRSRAAGGTVCRNCGFIGSTDVDMELLDGAGLVVSTMYSEQSKSMARVTAGPGGSGLTVTGGYWMWTHAAVGSTTIVGTNAGGHRTWLRLTDFMFTPLNGLNHGTLRGFAPSERFIDNTLGYKDETVAGL